MQKFNGRMKVMEKSLRVQDGHGGWEPEREREQKEEEEEQRHFKSSLTHTA